MKDSWALVAKSGDEVPLHFYSHLFLSHPELRTLFPTSMSAQRDKLVGALGRIVSNVDQVDEVLPFIEQLGRDHRRFSVIAEHYSAVGASLLATLQHFLGPAWTVQLAEDWAGAYGLIAKVMVQAAEEAADRTPAWWEAEVVSVERRTLDVSVVQLLPRQPLVYRPGQSVAMEIPQRPRLWRYFSPANAPREDGSVELHVQLIDGGQVSSAVVRSLMPGQVVRLGAPVGQALTRAAEDQRDLQMIAGGTGLAPLRAVLEQIDREWEATRVAPNVHLFHGARMPWSLYERNLLGQLTARPWFDYSEVISDDPSYPGLRGAVGSVAAKHASADGRLVMVCGSAGMVRHTVAQLTAAGVPAERIRREEFAGDTTPVSRPIEPPLDSTGGRMSGQQLVQGGDR
ncbi:globin domain-containing protein [Kribbella sp. NPDC050469]|uniref:globin domain-containing protein n=1 Tax=Kribbella sp. NPDC050469 TaxID=3364116 RepID=UPI0037B04BF2